MRLSILVTALVTVLVTDATARLSAQHWPAFRGPSGSGIAEAQPLPTSWDATKPAGILWKTAIPGLGHSSPAVWGDRVFVTTAVSSNPKPAHNPKDSGIDPANDADVHEWRILALDKSSGKILWSQTAHRGAPKTKRHVKATQANATPATDGRIVVVSFGSEGLYAYDMNGRLLWKHDLGVLDPGYWGQPDLQWGFASSPIIHNGLVILQCDIQQDSFIVAFNATDGTRAWRTARDERPAWSTPVIYQGKQRTELVTSGRQILPWLRSDDRQGAVAPVRRHGREGAVAGDRQRSVLPERRQSARPRFLRGAARRNRRHLHPRGSAVQRERRVAENARQLVHADAAGLWRTPLCLQRQRRADRLRRDERQGGLRQSHRHHEQHVQRLTGGRTPATCISPARTARCLSSRQDRDTSWYRRT